MKTGLLPWGMWTVFHRNFERCLPILEVPVGTGVLTMPIYQTLPRAAVTCLDYSREMMERAKRWAPGNVKFMQGDVGSLPFADGSFDLVLSLNGFHAFPDKGAAYRETFRVLKHGGTFCGCFYVKGENRRTDLFIDRLYTPKGFFTPPFETADSLRKGWRECMGKCRWKRWNPWPASGAEKMCDKNYGQD